MKDGGGGEGPARGVVFGFFFFNDTATTEIYTLSLHDALPISPAGARRGLEKEGGGAGGRERQEGASAARAEEEFGGQRSGDRKSTRLNSSHANISYAVFCLQKKK